MKHTGCLHLIDMLKDSLSGDIVIHITTLKHAIFVIKHTIFVIIHTIFVIIETIIKTG